MTLRVTDAESANWKCHLRSLTQNFSVVIYRPKPNIFTFHNRLYTSSHSNTQWVSGYLLASRLQYANLITAEFKRLGMKALLYPIPPLVHWARHKNIRSNNWKDKKETVFCPVPAGIGLGSACRRGTKEISSDGPLLQTGRII